MSILSHVRMPEHGQASPASVVFGVSDLQAPVVDVEALALAQRAEWHVDMSDDALRELAMHRAAVTL
jgi:hypothetical protein